MVNNINENTSDVGHDQNDNLSELPKGSEETTELPTLVESESSSVTSLGEEMSFDSSFYDNSTDNIVENNLNAGQDDLSGFLRVLGEMELIISSKGGGQEYCVDTCSDLDDILPTM